MKLSIIAVLTIIVALGYSAYEDYSFTQDLKSGKIQLECNLEGQGIVDIDPTKIESFDTDRNVAVFTNGYATNCSIIK